MTRRSRFAFASAIVAVVLAVLYQREVARRSLSPNERNPKDANGVRPLHYWGELNIGLHTLINVVVAPLVPKTLDIEPCIRIMNSSIEAYPKAARAMGFAGDDALWRTALAEMKAAVEEGQWLSTLKWATAKDNLIELAKYNRGILAFLETRMDGAALPPVSDLDLLFIVGNYRSGTSILQRLLAADSRIASLPQWILLKSDAADFREGMANPAILDSKVQDSPFCFVSPEVCRAVLGGHPFAGDLAEEDGLYLSEASLVMLGKSQWTAFAVPREGCCANAYRAKATMGSDAATLEAFYARALPGYLAALTHADSALWTQWKGGKQRKHALVLKAPLYGLALDLLKRAFPSAQFVATHRPPREQAASAVTQWAHSWPLVLAEHASVRSVTLNILDHVEAIAGGLVDGRALIDMHLAHEDIAARPIESAQHVLWNMLGLDSPPEERANMQNVLDGLPHSPALTDADGFGVDWASELRARPGFVRYNAAYYPGRAGSDVER